MRDQDLLNVTQTAAALRVSRPTASRAARDGHFGKPVVRKGTRRKLYQRLLVEASAGKPLSAAELAAAKATRDYTGPSRSDLLIDFASAILNLRDRQHLERVHALGFANYVPLPPFNPKGSQP